jgi:DinB superfamily
VRNIAPILELLSNSQTNYLATLDALPADRWMQRPRADAWSAAEITVHLTMVEHGLQKTVQRVLAAPPIEVPFLKRFHLPVRVSSVRLFKAKTPVPVKAERLGEKPELVASLAKARRATIDFLENNRAKNLETYRAPHPLLGMLDLYQWHEFLAYHQDRHRKQLRAIVDSFHP